MKDEVPSLLVPRAQLAVAVMGTSLRPSQRLRAQGVLALTAQLVRAAQAGRFETFETLVEERHRLVDELRAGLTVVPRNGLATRCVEESCVEAVAEAVAESDRALRAMRASDTAD